MKKLVRLIAEAIVFGTLGIVLILGIGSEIVPSIRLKQHFILWGIEETGAINLVSSIYLGYRVFDTLGETIILLLAVSGIIMLFEVEK